MGFIKDDHNRQVKNFLARHKDCTKDNHVCNTQTYLSAPIERRKPRRFKQAYKTNALLDKELRDRLERED